MDTMNSCPACYKPDALIALGARRDRPHRWRWWITMLTQLYLCEQCDAQVQVRATRGPLVVTVSCPDSRGADGPVRPPQAQPGSGAIQPAGAIWPAA